MPPRPFSRSILPAVALGFAALLIAWATGGLSASLINPDEGGHYVNALFLGDWIRAGFPAPMAFAQDYYAHFPRLSIGHWPPAWYILQAPIFAGVRPSPLGALMLSTFVAGLPTIAILWSMNRIGHWWLGVALGLAYLFLPVVLETSRYLLLDQPVALVVALAAIAWAWASERPGWRSFLTFALLAAAAPLVKGNGALIALVPAIDIALTGRWHLLKKPQLWVAAVLTLALVAPWYWLSFQISSGGFNYAPGLEYAGISLAANWKAIFASIGVGGLALALTGAVSGWLKQPEEARIARLAIAVIAATLLFQAIVPAAIEPRYITPMLPWLVVLAGLGLVSLWRAGQAQRGAAVTASVLACIPALLTISAIQPKPDIGAEPLAREMAREGGLWLVDARAGGEGAIIAAAAYADAEHRTVWVARASQWLSTSDFMGRDYKLTAETPGQARAVLDQIGAAGIVSIAERNRYAYPHSPILYRSVRGEEFNGARQSFATGPGAVYVARRWSAISPNIALIQASRRSVNLGKMTTTLR